MTVTTSFQIVTDQDSLMEALGLSPGKGNMDGAKIWAAVTAQHHFTRRPSC